MDSRFSAFFSVLSLLCAAAASAQDFEPRIVNGVGTHAFATTGQVLSGGNPDSAGSWCSGTLIGCSTFLTAAHCMCEGVGSQCQPGGPLEPDPTDWTVFLQHGGVHAVTSVSVHPAFGFPFADVAVLRLSQPVDGITPTALNTTMRPPLGTAALIAGFGRSGGGNFDYGLLRFGGVLTAGCNAAGVDPATSVCWRFSEPLGVPGEDSNTCNGDSGGPLFVDFGAGQVVAGITSGGTGFDCLPTDTSYDSDVFAWAPYIQAVAGGSLGELSCGGLSQIGERETDVDGFDGTLTAQAPEARHSFQVSAGKTQLRVTMNSVDDGPSNFDLYLKLGAQPTPSDFDCAKTGSGQFGACELSLPAEGTWHVLVKRVSGGGAYQVTATAFEGEPTPILGISLSSPFTAIDLGDPFPFAIDLQSPPGSPSTFDFVLALIPPGIPAFPLVEAPGQQLPPDSTVTFEPTLPLPGSVPTGTWRIRGVLFQQGREVSSDTLEFELR